MGNSFGGCERRLRLSNGGTDVFLSVLQFALSDVARDPWENALAHWVALHDQSVVGRGTVGFDLEAIEWNAAEFPHQKAFLLRTIDQALTRHRWDELCYDPPHAERYLREYREIVEEFALPAGPRPTWAYPWPEPDDVEERCDRHGIHCYPGTGRCRVCHDCEADASPPG